MKRLFLLGMLVLFSVVAKAQQVKEIVAEAQNDVIAVSCVLETTVPCSLQLHYSENDGLTWSDCKTVEGDLSNQMSGKKTLYWNCLKDNILMGNFIFKITLHPSDVATSEQKIQIESADVPEKTVPEETAGKSKGNFLVLPGCSFGNTVSFSLMAGYMKKWGGYVKIKSSFGGKDKDAIKGDTDDAFFTGNAKKGRFSVYAGTIGQLHPHIFMYVGVGYGNKWLQWETVDLTHMEIESGTYSGFDPEIGFLFRVKKFTFGGGFSCLIGSGHKSGEGNVSVGLMF